jgi:hypothetical protein
MKGMITLDLGFSKYMRGIEDLPRILISGGQMGNIMQERIPQKVDKGRRRIIPNSPHTQQRVGMRHHPCRPFLIKLRIHGQTNQVIL